MEQIRELLSCFTAGNNKYKMSTSSISGLHFIERVLLVDFFVSKLGSGQTKEDLPLIWVYVPWSLELYSTEFYIAVGFLA